MRFDVNYYYWPGAWVQNRPGMFTGSGFPMRFANTNGSMIDVYQATTQMTDESGIGVGNFCNTVLDRAQGPEGYYGVFTANMHTDTANHTGSNAIINSALAHNVPVVSAKQMLNWIDGRNNSSFGNITWTGNILTFNVTAAGGSTNLRGMLPSHSGTDVLSLITRSGTPVSFTLETIKGIEYAFFDASLTGSYIAVYGPLTTISGQITLQGRPAAPAPEWQVPVVVELYVTGRTLPVLSYTTTTDVNGHFTVSNVPVGNFNVAVKNIHALRSIKLNQNLITGGNTIDFGVLLEGDANNDNTVDLLDFSVLLSTYNKIVGDPGYDARADFNGDDVVDLLDFSILLPNYNTDGELNP